MKPSEITTAARPIRQILASQLSLCRAVYPPTHPDSTITAGVEQALEAFDKIVRAATLQAAQTERLGQTAEL